MDEGSTSTPAMWPRCHQPTVPQTGQVRRHRGLRQAEMDGQVLRAQIVAMAVVLITTPSLKT
jgi:hypothetical protein